MMKHKKDRQTAVFSAVCVLGGRKCIGFGSTLCLILRYPIILYELCSSYEQFVNDFPRNRLLQISPKISPESFQKVVTYTSGSRPQPAGHNGCYIHFPHGPRRAQAPYPSLPPAAKAHSFRCFAFPHRTHFRWASAGTPFVGQRPLYLYFWLSATANWSQRLLYSFSAWPLTQW